MSVHEDHGEDGAAEGHELESGILLGYSRSIARLSVPWDIPS